MTPRPSSREDGWRDEDDIAKVLDAEKGDDHHRLLEALRDSNAGARSAAAGEPNCWAANRNQMVFV